MKSYVAELLFLLGLVFNLSISYSQTPQEPGTFLRYSPYDAYYSVEYNLIDVADIDNDQQNEVVILAIDTLVIIKPSSISYLQAFNPLPTNLGAFSMKFCNSGINQSKIICIGQNFPATHWSYFYPHNNSFTYGNFDRPQQYYFTTDPSSNIWSINSVSVNNYFASGIFKSQEIFADTNLVTLVGQSDSLFSFENAGSYGFPTTIYSSKTGQFLSAIMIRDNIFTSGNPHGAYRYFSSDFGITWQGEIIIRGNKDNPLWGQISNRNLALNFKNQSMLSGTLDSLGIMHIAIWGIGKTIIGLDTINTSTMLYWNSRDKDWIAITDPAYESMIDGSGNSLEQFAPGFALGQSLPTISVSENGQIILIAWSVPEFIGEPGISSLNIYPGDGGQFSTPVYYTDYLANISYDGGKTWLIENIFPLKNKQNVFETFLSLNKKLQVNESTGKIRADFLYMIDPIPGLSGFGQNSQSTYNGLYYDSLVLYITPVEEEQIVVYDYSLSQNYPNPFNPSTKINYSIAAAGIVTIKIYNILGREISTLVNEEKTQGRYEVNFNASALASGVYFYQIKTGSFVSSKKMILIK